MIDDLELTDAVNEQVTCPEKDIVNVQISWNVCTILIVKIRLTIPTIKSVNSNTNLPCVEHRVECNRADDYAVDYGHNVGTMFDLDVSRFVRERCNEVFACDFNECLPKNEEGDRKRYYFEVVN